MAALPTNYKAKYHADISLYMEASFIANQIHLKEMLVTRDFFGVGMPTM